MALSHYSVWDKRMSCVRKFIKYISYAQKSRIVRILTKIKNIQAEGREEKDLKIR